MFKSPKLLLIITFIFSLILVAGCSNVKTATETGAVTLKYAKGFKIENLADGCQKVTDGEGRVLLLVPRGKQPPSDYQNLPIVYTPIKSAVIVSTTEAAFLRALNELGSIIGVNSKKELWYIDEVKAGMESGKIQMVGSGGMGPLDYDRLVALKPDIVFMSTSSSKDTQTLQKLGELKIPVAVNNSWLEQDPLGRLEWIKFIAAFYDKGQQADNFFANVVKNTENISAKVTRDKVKPKVLWGLIYQGKAYVPGADSYIAKMIAMAGGDYLFNNITGTGSSPITLEEYYAKGKEADIYIDGTMSNLGQNSIAGIIAQGKVLADLPTIKGGKVWGFQPWYYQSLDKTDEIIGDLAAIFHPNDFSKTQLKHFLQLPKS